MLRQLPLILTVLAAFALVVIRAHTQSITIDEATTFELWVAPQDATHWSAASNNHILNSVIMRAAVSAFGISHLTVRSGALVGAALYLLTALLLCVRLTDRPVVRWSAFVCFALNPFVLDYLVAARGYALASAFLLALVYLIAWYELEGPPPSPVKAAGVAGVLAALTIAANFAFAIVSLLLAGSFVLLLWWRSRKWLIPITAAAAGLAVSCLFTVPAIWSWPEGQLWWGASSMREMWQSLAQSVLHKPNPHVLNPLLLPAFEALRPWILPLLLLATLCSAVAAVRQHLHWRARLAVVLVAVLSATVALHWTAFKLHRMLLPKERTALYVVVLAVALIATLAAIRNSSRSASIANAALRCSLTVAAVYFLGCLRTGYFKEWEWDADVRRAYDTAAYYNHRHGIGKAASSWHYSSALNFYRVMSGRETFQPFEGNPPVRPGFDLYVLHGGLDSHFIEQHQLLVVYRSTITELVVALDKRFRAQQ